MRDRGYRQLPTTDTSVSQADTYLNISGGSLPPQPSEFYSNPSFILSFSLFSFSGPIIFLHPIWRVRLSLVSYANPDAR